MIVEVNRENIRQAARVHAETWRESHRAFCAPEFVAAHTVQRQTEYLERELKGGKKVWMLVKDRPVGIVSLQGNLIENLYVLPSEQRKGFGSVLLEFAMEHCDGSPALWVLSNNEGAKLFYHRHGFRFTGAEHPLSAGLSELEMAREIMN